MMTNDRTSLLSDVLGGLVLRVVRRAPIVLLIGMAVFVASADYSVHQLGINTDTVDMFSPELPFRRNYDLYKQQFPQRVDTLVIVVDALSPDLARQSADALADQLRDESTLFKSVYEPEGDPFLTERSLCHAVQPSLPPLLEIPVVDGDDVS